MYVCPLCNQFEQRDYECPDCHFLMEDRGRVMDYFDDYSAYLDIEGMKLFDGIPDDQQNHECPHLFFCPRCMKQSIYLIHEVEL